jgi:2-oxoglutarate dehydrogenase E2 component (dihydrolipoamide succinyltransferase)
MRQIIAEHMVRSKATSAHVTSFAEVDVTKLVDLVKRNKGAFLNREGVKLTFTPFFVYAAVSALKDHPILNASVDEKAIKMHKDIHIGIAVALGKTGLIAPVIRNAGQHNISGLAHAASDLADRARSKKLQPTTYRVAPLRLPTSARSAPLWEHRSSTSHRWVFSLREPSKNALL